MNLKKMMQAPLKPSGLLWAVVVMVVASHGALAASLREEDQMEGPRTNHRTKRAIQGGAQMQQYAMLCPYVKCPSIRDDCSAIEIIVFSYPFFTVDPTTGEPREIMINCESCPYCMDPPFRARRRRSHHHHEAQRRADQQCQHVQCPSIPENCENIRYADVLIQGRKCLRCPACFDRTILVNGVQ